MKQTDKQKLLLEYLLSSPDTFTLCKSILDADYFDPEYRKVVGFLNKYYEEYSALPSLDQVEAETSVALVQRTVTRDQIKYTTNEVESFCRRKAIERAVLASPALIEAGDYGKVEQLVRDAISVSLHRDLGLDYFKDPLSWLERLASSPLRTPTGFTPIDDLLGGGLARTEIILFCANSGGGKSITLANLGYNFLKQGKRVLYLTLELSEDLVGQRYNMMFTGIPSFAIQREYETIAYKLNTVSKELGHLVIKWMPSGTNSNAIRSYLKEYELQYGVVPDLLIVDYLDLMNPNEKVSADNIWNKDKLSTEQLKDVGTEYNLFVATASQLNRAALEAEEVGQQHTAGGISKVNTVDWQWAIQQTPAMKAQGEMLFLCLKSRSSDAVGKSVFMGWNNKFLRIEDPKEEVGTDNQGLKEALEQRKTMKGLPEKSRKSILDIMDN